MSNKKYGRKYILIPKLWLNDYSIHKMSDHDFRIMVTSMVNDSANWHYTGASPERMEWHKIRRHIAPLIFERGGNQCAYCGTTERLEIDHIEPLARGGSNDPDNLQILCRSCNGKKWIN